MRTRGRVTWCVGGRDATNASLAAGGGAGRGDDRRRGQRQAGHHLPLCHATRRATVHRTAALNPVILTRDTDRGIAEPPRCVPSVRQGQQRAHLLRRVPSSNVELRRSRSVGGRGRRHLHGNLTTTVLYLHRIFGMYDSLINHDVRILSAISGAHWIGSVSVPASALPRRAGARPLQHGQSGVQEAGRGLAGLNRSTRD